jgi:hypothetical protein
LQSKLNKTIQDTLFLKITENDHSRYSVFWIFWLLLHNNNSTILNLHNHYYRNYWNMFGAIQLPIVPIWEVMKVTQLWNIYFWTVSRCLNISRSTYQWRLGQMSAMTWFPFRTENVDGFYIYLCFTFVVQYVQISTGRLTVSTNC